MPVTKLPSPQMGMSVEELTTLMFKYYRELGYVLGHLDEDNVLRSKSVISDWVYTGGITTDQLEAGEAKIGTAMIEDLAVGTNVFMGPDASISWGNVIGTENIPTRNDLVWNNIGDKPTDLLTQPQLVTALTDYVTNGTMTAALANTLNTGNFSTIITKDYIASMNLVVGNEILMGDNATISWSKITGAPSIPSQYTDAEALQAWVSSGYKTYITSSGVYTGNIVANQITSGSLSANIITSGTLSADRISGGTLSGVTLNVNTNATVGNVLRVGPDYQYIDIYNSGGTGYLRSSGGEVLKFVSSGDVHIRNSLYVYEGESLGYHNGFSASAGTDCITFNQNSPYISMKKPVTFNATVYLSTISSSNSISISTSSYGNTISLSSYGNLNLTSSNGRIVLSPYSSYGVQLNGYLGFFGGTPVSKTSVSDPSSIGTGSAPSSWSSSWGGYVKSDLDNLKSKLTSLIDALQSYGLV